MSKLEEEEGQPPLGSGVPSMCPTSLHRSPRPTNRWRSDQIRLLTDENDLAKRTTVEDLTKFIKQFDKIAEEVLSKCRTPCKVLVQFTCAPSGHTVKIMHQPKDIDEKPLDELYAAIVKMDKLPVKEKTVEFQIQLTIVPEEPTARQREMTVPPWAGG